MGRCRLAACFVYAYVVHGVLFASWHWKSLALRIGQRFPARTPICASGHRFGFVFETMNHLKVKCLSRAWELLNAFHRIFSIRCKSVSRLPYALRGDVRIFGLSMRNVGG